MNVIARTADILGATFFLILSVYFINKPNRTYFETFLMIGSIIGLVLDVIFTINYYRMIL